MVMLLTDRNAVGLQPAVVEADTGADHQEAVDGKYVAGAGGRNAMEGVIPEERTMRAHGRARGMCPPHH